MKKEFFTTIYGDPGLRITFDTYSVEIYKTAAPAQNMTPNYTPYNGLLCYSFLNDKILGGVKTRVIKGAHIIEWETDAALDAITIAIEFRDRFGSIKCFKYFSPGDLKK